MALVTVDTPLDIIDLDDGLTSLREAIFATNLVSGPDEITFDFGHDGPETIVLTQGELRINDDLTVAGPGASLLTIDASGSDPTPDQNNGDGSRVLNVDNGDDVFFINVTLRGLTLTGGDAQAAGGAIRSREHFTLRDCVVSGSAAVSTYPMMLSYGGGIAHSNGLLTVTGSIIADNFGDFGGGIHLDAGQAFLASTIITANVGLSGAGIYSDDSVAFISRSAIRGNSAGAFSLGGGIYSSGNLSVFDTTISGNSADYGGGIFSRTDSSNMESTLIVNSTISGNTAFSRGGGVRNAYGETRIEFSTITGNTAPPGQGSGVASRGYASATTRVSHTIIAGNTNSDIDFGTGTVNTFVSRGYNLIGSGNAAAAFQGPGDQTGVAIPLLGPLADNGGFTLPDGSRIFTHALLPGSPAINMGDLTAKAGMGGIPTYDQRLEPFSRVVNGRIDIGAFEYQSPSDLNLVVDTLADESDNDYGIGDLSLREAIELANLYPSDDTIRFDPALTAAGPATILLAKGELAITDDVSIVGPGANLLTIDASGNDPTPDQNNGDGTRIFNIDNGISTLIDVSIGGLTLTGGDVRSNGGGVLSMEDFSLSRSVVTENYAGSLSPGRGGGGVYIGGGSASISDSQIYDNESSGEGGGIQFAGDLTIERSSITGNKAAERGGGILNGFGSTNGSLTLIDSEVSGNTAKNGGGIALREPEQHTILRSRVTGNTAVGGFPANYFAAGGGILAVAGSLQIIESTIEKNSALGAGGGIYAGRYATVALEDVTISDNSASHGGGIFSRIPFELLDSTVSGNSATDSGGGIYIANASSGFSIRRTTILGNSAGRIGGGIASRNSDGSGALSLVDSNVRDNTAPGGGGIYIIGESAVPNRIIRTLVAGNAATGSDPNNPFNGDGGGILLSLTSATVSESTIAANTANDWGGGIYSTTSFTNSIEFDRLTVSTNRAAAGGGIHMRNGTINHTTFHGNQAVIGGGLFILNNTVVNHSTIVHNSSTGIAGGIYVNGGELKLNHSIVARHFGLNGDVNVLAGATVAPRFSVVGWNVGSGLAEAPVGSPDRNGNFIGGPMHGIIDPMVGPLADNGGSTLTHALLPGSPAINAGDPVAMAGVDGVPEFDQRGAPFTRVYGGRIDIGAFEAQPNPLPGDYNFNGVVNAADFVVWRKTLNSTSDLRADGNGDGIVNNADWQVWRTNFGRTAESTEQGAQSTEKGFESGEPEAVRARPQRPAWQPPVNDRPWRTSPGVFVATSRAAFRPPTQRFDPADDLLMSLTSPLEAAGWLGQRPSLFDDGWGDAPGTRRQPMREMIANSNGASIDVVDRVFDTLGAL